MAKKVEKDEGEQQGKAIRLISPSALKGYHSDAKVLAGRIANIVGDLGKLTSEAVTKKYLNSKAYKICAWCLKQEPEKAAAFLASFDHMRKVLKVDEHAELQGRLFPDGETPAKTEGDDDDGRDFRPRHLRQPDASAASGAEDAVKDLAAKAGAKTQADPIDQVGRGGKTNLN